MDKSKHIWISLNRPEACQWSVPHLTVRSCSVSDDLLLLVTLSYLLTYFCSSHCTVLHPILLFSNSTVLYCTVLYCTYVCLSHSVRWLQVAITYEAKGKTHYHLKFTFQNEALGKFFRVPSSFINSFKTSIHFYRNTKEGKLGLGYQPSSSFLMSI